jgi:hypothetical protein
VELVLTRLGSAYPNTAQLVSANPNTSCSLQLPAQIERVHLLIVARCHLSLAFAVFNMGCTCSVLESTSVFELGTPVDPFSQEGVAVTLLNPNAWTTCPASGYAPSCVSNTIELLCLLELADPPDKITICADSGIYAPAVNFLDVTGVKKIECEDDSCFVIRELLDEVEPPCCTAFKSSLGDEIKLEDITFLDIPQPDIVDELFANGNDFASWTSDVTVDSNAPFFCFNGDAGIGSVTLELESTVGKGGKDKVFKKKAKKQKGGKKKPKGKKRGKKKGKKRQRQLEMFEREESPEGTLQRLAHVPIHSACTTEVHEVFASLDTDGDGFISMEEAGAYLKCEL